MKTVKLKCYSTKEDAVRGSHKDVNFEFPCLMPDLPGFELSSIEVSLEKYLGKPENQQERNYLYGPISPRNETIAEAFVEYNGSLYPVVLFRNVEYFVEVQEPEVPTQEYQARVKGGCWDG